MAIATTTLFMFQIAILDDSISTASDWGDDRGAEMRMKTYVRRTINSEAAAKGR
jgi:hypothetical protein